MLFNPSKYDFWHKVLDIHPIRVPASPCSFQTVTKQTAAAEEMLEADLEQFEKWKQRNSTDDSWLSSMIDEGTLHDRISALVLLVQEAPMYRLDVLDQLIDLCQTKQRRLINNAITALADLFISIMPTVAIPKFNTLDLRDGTPEEILCWYCCNLLVQRFMRFISVLEHNLGDPLWHFRLKTSEFLALLIDVVPQSRKRMLSVLVNVLGDAEKRVAAKVCDIVVRKLKREWAHLKTDIFVLLRDALLSSESERQQFYSVVVLNQLPLTKTDSATATLLVAAYLSIFVNLKKQDEKMNASFISNLLLGLNTFIPICDLEHEDIMKNIDLVFKLTHHESVTVGVRALSLVFHLVEKNGAFQNRFYKAMYSFLVRKDVLRFSKFEVFMNLLYRAMKGDSSLARVAAFVKRIFAVCMNAPAEIVASFLFLVSEVAKTHSNLFMLFDADNNIVGSESDSEDEEDEDEKEEMRYAEPVAEEAEPIIEETEDNMNLSILESMGLGSTSTTGAVVAPVEAKSESTPRKSFDPTARDPLFANGEHATFYELDLLCKHYHPSVATFASILAGRFSSEGRFIEYGGSPLEDFSVVSFLDKFSGRKMKKQNEFSLNWRETIHSMVFEDGETNLPPDLAFMKTFVVKEKERNQKKALLTSLDVLDDFDMFDADIDDDLADLEGLGIDIDEDEDDEMFAAMMNAEDDAEEWDEPEGIFSEAPNDGSSKKKKKKKKGGRRRK
ncbi:hypothetical protein PCE1_002031 [Barthelona sp. PCE]